MSEKVIYINGMFFQIKKIQIKNVGSDSRYTKVKRSAVMFHGTEGLTRQQFSDHNKESYTEYIIIIYKYMLFIISGFIRKS